MALTSASLLPCTYRVVLALGIGLPCTLFSIQSPMTLSHPTLQELK